MSAEHAHSDTAKQSTSPTSTPNAPRISDEPASTPAIDSLQLIAQGGQGGAPVLRRALTNSSVVALQRHIGNQAVQRLIANARAAPIQRAVDASRHEADVSSSVASTIESARGSGRAIERDVRRPMERSFGVDLSGVRVHSGSHAAALNQEVGARAFTNGQDIFFGGGGYDPGSQSGRALLTHELTHVVQQARGGVTRSGQVQAAPTVTAVVAPGDVGVGKSISTKATVAGSPQLTWTLVGGPAGVTLTPSGRTARITATAASKAAAGASFKVQAALKSSPADSAVSGPINLVGVTGITFTANPAFSTPVLPLGWAAPFPPGTADPNRDGLSGNTAVAAVVTAPAGRPTTLTTPVSLGSSVVGGAIQPGTATGNVTVRATDDGTKSFLDQKLPVNPVPTRLSAFTAQAGAGAPGVTYGAKNTIGWGQSDTANPLPPRVIGETITAGGSDDFGYTATVNGGPNPAPTLKLAVPSNAWTDQLFTGVGPNAGAPGDKNAINVNKFVGPGVAKKLPAVWILRQGFHYLSWTGAWSTEFDNGIHRRSLVKAGAGFKFTTEHIFPAASAKLWSDAYAGPPLIVLSAVTTTPSVPAAVGLAADGLAQANVTVATTVPGRNVNWTVTSGPIAITGGAGVAVGAAAKVQAGMVAGNFPVKVVDSVFPNRLVEGKVKVVPVKVRGMAAPVRTIPAGTLIALVNVNADPGGRTVSWTVDAAAAAAGVTVVGGIPAANLPPRTATVSRPAAFKGKVTVTASDSVVTAKKDSIKLTFK